MFGIADRPNTQQQKWSGVKCVSKLQNHPSLHSPLQVGRNMTDQTHPNLQPHTGGRPGIQEQTTHPSLYPLVGDDCRLTYSNRSVQIPVGLELAEYGQMPLNLDVYGCLPSLRILDFSFPALVGLSDLLELPLFATLEHVWKGGDSERPQRSEKAKKGGPERVGGWHEERGIARQCGGRRLRARRRQESRQEEDKTTN